MQGSYSYTGPDGILYTVNYIADENGFRASVIQQTKTQQSNNKKVFPIIIFVFLSWLNCRVHICQHRRQLLTFDNQFDSDFRAEKKLMKHLFLAIKQSNAVFFFTYWNSLFFMKWTQFDEFIEIGMIKNRFQSNGPIYATVIYLEKCESFWRKFTQLVRFFYGNFFLLKTNILYTLSLNDVNKIAFFTDIRKTKKWLMFSFWV